MKKYLDLLPEFCMSHWLLRVPLSIVFIQQGFSKIPISIEDADSFELPYIVWWFAAYGEIGAGIGLIVSGIIGLNIWGFFTRDVMHSLSDLLTRFCGITICCIMTGVIWVGKPDSLMDVLLYDNLHVFLWVGGLFFALRGKRA
jgi:putative oxidoreductase|tara:strand:- start:139 stop:567 length:429 start_codon:yes stop_codon:yes gene_type:complete